MTLPLGAHDIIHLMRNICFLTFLVTLFACSAAPAQQNDTAARVGSRTITTKELDDRWRADDPAAQAEATQKLYDGRRAALCVSPRAVRAPAPTGQPGCPTAAVGHIPRNRMVAGMYETPGWLRLFSQLPLR